VLRFTLRLEQPPHIFNPSARRREYSNMTSKVWFITGTSKGFGRVWAQAALAREIGWLLRRAM